MKIRTLAPWLLFAAAAASWAQTPARIVMGGRAVVMVADAVYAFPSARSLVVAVGGTDQGLGTFLEAVAPGFLAKPPLDRQAGAEAYAALKPDLVILKSGMRGALGAGFEALGIKALYLDLESPEDYYEDLAVLGAALGQEARAGELVAYYRDIVERVAATRGPDRKRVLVVQATGDGYEVPPDSWMQTRLVEMAGGIPVWKGSNPGSGWAKVGPEQMAAWNPDIVVVISYREGVSAVAARVKADPRLSGLEAVADGAVYGFPQDFYSWDQPDTRWGLGLLWLGRILGPAGAERPTMESEARRFFALFYGFDAAAFDRVILPRLAGDWQR